MRRSWLAAGAVLAAGLAASSEARAQYWLADRALTEGRGIRAGNFELHPGFGAEFGYDSNVTAAPSQAGFTISPALRLRLTPSIAISTLGPQRGNNTAGGAGENIAQANTGLPTVNFRAQLALTYHHFFPVTQPDQVSRFSNLGGTAGFRAEFFPGRTWQFQIGNDLSRLVQGAPDVALTLNVFNRFQNQANAQLIWAPNGGIVDFRIGYTNRLQYFEDTQAFGAFTNMSHEIMLRNRWRFLPKTAFMWEGAITPTTFLNPTAGFATGLFNSYPIRTRFGLNGLLSERVGILLLVGYQGTYFVGGDNADTVIAQAEVKYIFSPLTSFRLGLLRDVQPSFLGNFYIRNQVYTSFNQSFLNGRAYFAAELSAGLLENGFISNTAGMRDASRYMGAVGADGRFSMIRLLGTVFGEYRFSDVVGVNATMNLSSNLSDVQLVINRMPPPGQPGTQQLQWVKFEAFVGARVNW